MRSYFFLVWMIGNTLVFGIILLILNLFNIKYSLLQHYWAKCALFFFKVEVEGLGNLPEAKNFITFSNHQSYLDILLLASILKKNYIWLAKAELFKTFFLGSLLNILGHIAIDRENKRKAAESLIAAIKALKNKKNIILFPEGTWNERYDKMLDFKEGFYFLARRSQAPILPVVLIGCHRVNPPDTLIFNPGKLKIKVLKPIDFKEYSKFDKIEFLKEMRSLIERTLIQESNN